METQLGDLDHQLVVAGEKLVQRRIDQPDHDGRARHLTQDAHEVLPLDGQELIEDLAGRLVLEALSQGDPEVAQLCKELGFAGFGRAVGLVDHLRAVYEKLREEGLSPARGAASLARIAVSPSAATADRMPDAPLEGLRAAIPAARSLPLLVPLARCTAGRVVLDYLDGERLAVQVSACR